MVALNDRELQSINGGVAVWAILGIFGVITFIIGLIDGYVRPIKCNK